MRRKLYQAEVTNCMKCPSCKVERTEGAGYAFDFLCKAADNKVIESYVEYKSEEPKDGEFPDFCPLKEVE